MYQDVDGVRRGRVLDGVAAGVATSILSFISTWMQMYSASTAMMAKQTECNTHHAGRLKAGD